ncbi:4079_t:CDS:2 [Funneliformis mosseae]|uniref:4079_t:CDS:1 n=1 Tax=Funneliformis mosseae TaxID=27381 RepID=A0A9N8ZBT0_FUNMO|nr:4079_t:CDS:2 [Funneliformis mosseae]
MVTIEKVEKELEEAKRRLNELECYLDNEEYKNNKQRKRWEDHIEENPTL